MYKFILFLTLVFSVSSFAAEEFFVLTFVFNTSNLQPVIREDCIKYKNIIDAKAKAEESVKAIEEKNFKCEKKDGLMDWTCRNPELYLISQTVVLRDKKECKNLPKKFISDLKTLSNKE